MNINATCEMLKKNYSNILILRGRRTIPAKRVWAEKWYRHWDTEIQNPKTPKNWFQKSHDQIF